MEDQPLKPISEKKISVITNLSADQEPAEVPLRKSSARRQWIITILANLSILSAGMALGFPAVSLQQLTSEHSPTRLNADQASWFASINAITCPLGGLLGSFILDKLGRKVTLIIINVLQIISWSLQAWTDKNDTETMYYQLLVARLILGELSVAPGHRIRSIKSRTLSESLVQMLQVLPVVYLQALSDYMLLKYPIRSSGGD